MYAKRAQPTVSIEPVSAGRERCRFDNTRSCLEKVVSRPGIEPGTFRLRVLCNQGSGEVTPRLYARHCAGEVRRDRLRRKYWNTPEIGSPAIDPRPARPPLTCCAGRHLTLALHPLPASGGIAIYSDVVVVGTSR